MAIVVLVLLNSVWSVLIPISSISFCFTLLLFIKIWYVLFTAICHYFLQEGRGHDLSLFQLSLLGQEGGGKFKYTQCHYFRRFFMKFVPKSLYVFFIFIFASFFFAFFIYRYKSLSLLFLYLSFLSFVIHCYAAFQISIEENSDLAGNIQKKLYDIVQLDLDLSWTLT